MHLSLGILVFNYVNVHSMTRTLTALEGAVQKRKEKKYNTKQKPNKRTTKHFAEK